MLAEFRVEGGTLTLALRGRLDADGARVLGPVVERLAEGPAARVVVDLGGVDFMDGSGLGALAYAMKRGGTRRVRLAGATGQPLALLRHLGLEGVLDRPAAAPRAGSAWSWLGFPWRRSSAGGAAPAGDMAWAGGPG